jgi:catechol-2,3-dioxygenase
MTLLIDHINISAPMELLLEVKEFYCAVFGLVEGFRPAFSQIGFWLYAGDSPIIHLSESDDQCSSDGQGFLDHVAFQATGARETVDKLKSHRIEYRSAFVQELGMTQLFFKDPAGTGIEVNFPGEAL